MIRVDHLRQKPGSKSCLVISVKMVLDGYGAYHTEEEIGTVIEYNPVLGASLMNIDLLDEAWGIMTESGEINLQHELFDVLSRKHILRDQSRVH